MHGHGRMCAIARGFQRVGLALVLGAADSIYLHEMMMGMAMGLDGQLYKKGTSLAHTLRASDVLSPSRCHAPCAPPCPNARPGTRGGHRKIHRVSRSCERACDAHVQHIGSAFISVQ